MDDNELEICRSVLKIALPSTRSLPSSLLSAIAEAGELSVDMAIVCNANTTPIYMMDESCVKKNGVTDMLMIPEYLMYKLCGTKAREYTNATTTGMINADTGEFDTEIIQRLGLPELLFPKPQSPKTVIGEYEGIKVVLCATHDTASAVEGIPMNITED